jgi:hypothetical protein
MMTRISGRDDVGASLAPTASLIYARILRRRDDTMIATLAKAVAPKPLDARASGQTARVT